MKTTHKKGMLETEQCGTSYGSVSIAEVVISWTLATKLEHKKYIKKTLVAYLEKKEVAFKKVTMG
jgi:hypothetical protein